MGNGVLGVLCAISTRFALILKLLSIFKALDGDVLYAEFYNRIINQPQESVYQTVTDGMNLLKTESAVLQISEGSLKVKFKHQTKFIQREYWLRGVHLPM